MKKTSKENNYQHYKEMAVKQHHSSKRNRMFSPQDDLKTLLPKQVSVSTLQYWRTLKRVV